MGAVLTRLKAAVERTALDRESAFRAAFHLEAG